MSETKDLKYSINSENHFQGIPFFKKLKTVSFLRFDNQVAEFLIDKKHYSVNFQNSEKIEIYCEDKIGTEFKITDVAENRTWIFSNPNKTFSIFKKSPDYLIESSNIKIDIDIRNNSLIYLIENNIIGRIEDKNILFKNGTNRIDVFDEKYERILISACCVELIRYHILKFYEPNE
ncbi:hypothetical protein [Flavobacterium praedii]|uniref:hypothetical protein n=1 Tax=Flavobacterium praedii TaxID=3002900 RepID=UPI002481B3CE|nr:hypothetical protein [Flavobacterium praedii]